MCWHIYRHLDISTHLPAQEQMCWHMSAYFSTLAECVSILMHWHMCRYLNMPTYVTTLFVIVLTNMQTYPDADIYVDILRFYWWSEICRHICKYIYSCAGKYIGMSRCRHLNADTSRCWHTCQHVEMATHSTSCEEYVDNMSADILRCRHIIPEMPKYMSTQFVGCWQICRHIEMPTYTWYMSTH